MVVITDPTRQIYPVGSLFAQRNICLAQISGPVAHNLAKIV